jgi:hypothetical protein
MSRYKALEKHLEGSKQECLEQAKQLRESFPSEAANKMRLYKRYEEELKRVLEYCNALPTPPQCPTFSWSTRKVEVPSEVNKELGDDVVAVNITRVTDFTSVLSKYVGASISCKYNLGVPIDVPIEGATPRVRIDQLNVSNLPISVEVQHAVQRKKSYSKNTVEKTSSI